MKNLLVYYRVVSYVLVGIAVLFSFFDLVFLLMAFAQPSVFLVVFIVTGVIIYSFASFSFLINGIQYGRQCKPSSKDWIKVNAYVSIAFGAVSLMQGIALLSDPSKMTIVIKQMYQMQGQVKMPGVSDQELMATIKGILYVYMSYSLVLLLHVYTTLRYIKEYAHLFGEKNPQA